MKRRKRTVTRKGRALWLLALTVVLVLLVHLTAESRLLPSWVKGIAEDEYATGPTRMVAALGTMDGSAIGDETRYRCYFSAGENVVLFYHTCFSPRRLGWVLTGKEVVSLTEEKTVHCGAHITLLRMAEGRRTDWRCYFGRVDDPAAETFVLNSYVVQSFPGEPEPRIEADTVQEMARFGTEECFYRDGCTYFAHTFEWTKDNEGPGRIVRLEVYGADGELLGWDWAGHV